MDGRISITFVVVFWLMTMTWLMWTKVLPPLLHGDPPNYKSIVSDHEANPAPSAWMVSYNGKRFGVAVSRLKRSGEMSRIHSFVKFDRLPLEEFPFLPALLGSRIPQIEAMKVQVHSTLMIDTLGRLLDLESRMRVNGMELLRLNGVVDAGILNVTATSSFFGKRKFQQPLGSNSLLGNQLSPQDRLPGLRVGQHWTVPVYSVIRSLKQENPIEIAFARVVREDLISVGGKKMETHLVLLGSDPGAGDRDATGRMWVAKDGTVVRQEMRLPFGGKLQFERRDDATSTEIFERVERAWQGKPQTRNTSTTRKRVSTMRRPTDAHPLGRGSTKLPEATRL